MTEFLGWDIGGAHLKRSHLSLGADGAARLSTSIVPFEIWTDPAGLAGRLRRMAAGDGARVRAQAVTMTAELSDVYPSRAAGVRSILEACREAFDPAPFTVFERAGGFLSVDGARERPLEVAAANWMATALLASRRVGTALLIDTGSTTTDIIPIVDSRPRPLESDDTGRLRTGELVYSGALRTPPCSYAERVPLKDGWCAIVPEHFAISADVHLILGRIDEAAYTVPTPDGRGRSRREAMARLARLVCADGAALGEQAILDMAQHLADRQAEQIARAIREVRARHPRADDVVAIVCGAGAFLAAEGATRAGVRTLSLRDLFPRVAGEGWEAAAPSAALALLLAESEGALDPTR